MLYTFRCAVYFANTYGQLQDKEKLNGGIGWIRKRWIAKQKMPRSEKKLKV
jgi:hypothetical protein